ncbi:MAG: hypothetical protein IT534_07055 [Bauldia sp.]|nr:hypothetical protein [Bauldia sp.]
MGQVVIILVVIAVGIVLWRSFGQTPATRRPPEAPARPRATELQRDPETGIYHPVEREKR